jgi:hypothetical protein
MTMPVLVPPTLDFNAANGKQLALIRTTFILKDMVDLLPTMFADAAAGGAAPAGLSGASGARAGSSAASDVADPNDQSENVGGHEQAKGTVSIGSRPKPSLIEDLMNDVRGPAAAQRWLARLASMRRRVCLIKKEQAMGTGFLVGSDLVLSAGRVPIGGPSESSVPIIVQFDFEMVEGALLPSRLLPVRTVDIEGAWSPSSTEDLLQEGAPVWFALLQLDESVGVRTDQRGIARGWFDLTAAVTDFVPGEPLFLLHHPLGSYIHMSQGSLVRAETSSRLRFEGDTAPGSSGAPVFNRDFRLVGLHEGRLAPTGNSDKVALRADAIANALKAKGRLPLPWIESKAVPAPLEE